MSCVGEDHCGPYQAPTKGEKEESERLRGEVHQMKFIGFLFERGQAV